MFSLLLPVAVTLTPVETVYAYHTCTTPPYTVASHNSSGVGECHAPDGGAISTLDGFITRLNDILNTLVPFIVGLAVFVIIYGIFGYIRHSADEEKRTEAKLFVLWGVIGVFIMVSIWGFVSILVNTFVLNKNAPTVQSIFPK